MKVKLTLEESKQEEDTLIIVDDLHFIIDQTQLHYFRDKTLEYVADKHGFKQFEIN